MHFVVEKMVKKNEKKNDFLSSTKQNLFQTQKNEISDGINGCEVLFDSTHCESDKSIGIYFKSIQFFFFICFIFHFKNLLICNLDLKTNFEAKNEKKRIFLFVQFFFSNNLYITIVFFCVALMLVLSNDSDYFKIYGEEKYGIDALIPELHSRNNVIVGKVVIIDELMIYFQKNIFEKINPICESLSLPQLRKLTSVSSFVQGLFFFSIFVYFYFLEILCFFFFQGMNIYRTKQI